MNLTFHWFKQNVESPTSNSFAVVQSDFVKITSDFYQNLMNGKGTKNAVQRAFDIHQYLMLHHKIIFKRFIFFVTNINNNHWIINCVCNPWMYLIHEWKTTNANNISKKISSLMDDRFVHRFLLLIQYMVSYQKIQFNQIMVNTVMPLYGS